MWWGFLALVVWLPLPLGSNRVWAWSVAEIWIMVLATGWLVLFWREKVALSVQFTRAGLVLAAFGLWLLWGLLQLLPLPMALLETVAPNNAHAWQLVDRAWAPLSVDPHATGAALLKSVAYCLVFVLTLLLLTSRRRVRWLAWAIVGAGFFQALYGGVMALSDLNWGFFSVKTVNQDLATGTFVNRNHFAFFLVLCLSVGIGLLLSMMRARESAETWRQRLRDWAKVALGPKARLRLMLVVMVIGLVLSRSRMGNTAFFAGLLIAGVTALILFRGAPRPVVILLASLVIVDIAVIGTWFGMDQVIDRIEATGQVDESGVMQDRARIDVDANAMDAWKDFPVFGAGGGSFYAVFPSYRVGGIEGFYDHAHNDYLELLVEYGVVGLALLGFILTFTLGVALRAQRVRRDPLMRGMGFAVTMALVALLIHSFVDFNLQIPANAAYVCLLLGLAWTALYLKPQRRVGT